MDKYEFKLKLDEMKALVSAYNYKAAAEIAETINWRKVRNINAMVLAGEIFEQVGRYEESKEILLLAYDKAPIGRNIIYRLAEIAIKTKNFDEVKEYYDEFVDIAPHDNLKYVLKYKMTAAQGLPYKDQIEILEELKVQEYSEEWIYELAYLYHMDGQPEKCVEVCDELILWFGDGIYVEKALELKMHYQPLTKVQEEKYRLFRQKRTGVIEVKPDDFLESGEIINETVSVPSVITKPEKYNTANLQQEIEKGMQQIMEAQEKEDVSDAMDNIKKVVEEIPYLSISEKKDEENPKETQEAVVEEEIDKQIDREIDESLTQIFQEDAGMREQRQEEEPQSSIDDILADWERTKQATQAVLKEAEEKKLESAKEKALKEAETLMERLMNVMPQLTAGVTPKELLEKEYLQGTGVLEQEGIDVVENSLEEAGKIVAGMNHLIQEQIDSLTGANTQEKQDTGTKQLKDPTRELPELPEEDSPGMVYEQPMGESPEGVPGTQALGAADTEFGDETQYVNPYAMNSDQGFYEESDGLTEDSYTESGGFAEGSYTEDGGFAENPYPEGSGFTENPYPEGGGFAENPYPEGSGFVEDSYPEDGDLVEGSYLEAAQSMGDTYPEADQGLDDAYLEAYPDSGQMALQNEAGSLMVEAPAASPAAREELEQQFMYHPPKTEEELAALLSQATKELPRVKPEILPEVETPEAEQTAARDPLWYQRGYELDDYKKGYVTDEINRQSTKIFPAVKEPIKEPEEKRLTPEQKKIFSYFVPIAGMEAQIYDLLGGVAHHLKWDKNALTGNIIIEGISGSGKTVLIMDIIKVLQKELKKPNGKIGKIDATSLNQKDLGVLIEKISGGCLIIESAGKITRETAVNLSACMEMDHTGTLYILEDTQMGIRKALERDSSFAEKFTEKITIPFFTSDELVAFGKAYANDLDYDIDEMGILALYNRISNIQKLDHVTTLTEVKEIVDEAIRRAEKGAFKKVFGMLTSTRYNEENYIVLHEKDFEEN